jgi:Holliday junction resolvasome RuvABC endonuclease subunit
MSLPFIVCFDLATTTGCCDGIVGTIPRYWNWDLRDAGEGRPARLLHLWNFLGAYLTEYRVDRVFYEAPMPIAVMTQIGATDDVVQFLRGAIGVVELAAAAHDVPIASWRVQEARQAVIGRGRFQRGTAKKEVMKYVRLIGHEPDDDNTADAIVGWLYESAILNPGTAHASTPLFGGARAR